MIAKKKISKTKNKIKLDEFYDKKDSEVVVKYVPYSITLNKTEMNINNNKFYICQLIKNSNNYTLFSRYGRVGVKGQITKKDFKDEDAGIKAYKKLIESKKKKEYIEIFLDDGEEKEIDEKTKKKLKVNDLKKEKEVIDLVNLVFNKSLLKKDLNKLGYNEEKLPLGKLAEKTITQGFEALEKIEEAIKNKNKTKMTEYNNKFFSLIPHNIGSRHVSELFIDNLDKLKEENLKLVVIKNMKKSNELISVGDLKTIKQKYDMLRAEINLLKSNDEIYKCIEKAFLTTNQSYKVKINSIFKVERKEEIFNEKKGNKHLLWHGSIIPNFVGIISQGLRIAPKEAPHNGYAYGKGIYMADCSNLSLGFSRAVGKGETGLILLVEAALGKQHSYYGFDKKKHDTCFQGTPLNCKNFEINGSKLFHSPKFVNYNMFISYNTEYVRIRYIIRYEIL